MVSWLRRLLTRRRIIVDPSTGRRVRIVEEPPSRRFITVFIVSLIILIVLTAAQVAWLLLYGEWNSSLFSGLIAVLCLTLGQLWGRKG